MMAMALSRWRMEKREGGVDAAAFAGVGKLHHMARQVQMDDTQCFRIEHIHDDTICFFQLLRTGFDGLCWL